MSAVLKDDLCGVCKRELQEYGQKYVKIKSCGHVFHEKCFFNEKGSCVTIADKIRKFVCPQDKTWIISANEEDLMVKDKRKEADWVEKIEIGEFPENKSLKIASYIAIAIVTMCIAVVIYPSLIALGIGFLVSIPLGYLAGKQIDEYLPG